MAIRIVRLGSPRSIREGVRVGAVRRPPRGVRKSEYAKRDFYDAWMPELAPSQKWVSWVLSAPFTENRWARFAKNYRREMSKSTQQRLLGLLAQLSHEADFSVGCYCEDEAQCHRSLLRELLVEHGASVAPRQASRPAPRHAAAATKA